MKVTFIGTGSGSTSLKRYHSSLLISSSSYSLLVDTGDGISRALLSSHIPYNSINGIFITHFHPDHFTGLPALLVQMKMADRNNPLEIYVHSSNTAFLEEFLFNSYILQERYGFDIKIKSIDTFFADAPADDLTFVTQENSHILKYSDNTAGRGLSLVSLSTLFTVEGIKIFYTGDVGDKKDLELFNSYDYLITECTHVSFDEIEEAAAKDAVICLTHINESEEEKIKRRIALKKDRQFLLAEDGMVIKE
jgi:ribonuclease Z